MPKDLVQNALLYGLMAHMNYEEVSETVSAKQVSANCRSEYPVLPMGGQNAPLPSKHRINNDYRLAPCRALFPILLRARLLHVGVGRALEPKWLRTPKIAL